MGIKRQPTNTEIAELLRSVAASYQLKDEKKNLFRIVAYQRAADAVEHASSELKDLWDEGKLDEVPGIGKSIAAHLDEMFRTGKSKHFANVMQGLPKEMFPLMEVPGIGAKTAFKLVKKLKIKGKNPLKELESKAKAGKIENLEGFGKESQKDIISAIGEVKGRVKRFLLPYANEIAEEIIAWMEKEPAVKHIDTLGSLRRQASTIGDIDISVASNNPEKVLKHFVRYPNTQRVLERGERSASIIVPGGAQVDLMVQPPNSYGSLLQHFTGSKHHNIALREYALKKGLSLSEYGIRKRGSKGLIKFSDEVKFYNYLNLEWIPPELREDGGEIAASRNHQIPDLVELKDIKADLQIHSDFNIETSHDLGESSMQEIVDKASSLGYEYLAFTEHNPSQKGHTESKIIDILKEKKEVIEKLNYSLVKGSARLRETSAKQVKKVFNSLEIDILPVGKLPIPKEAFNYLDFALVSVHSSFKQSKADVTKRVLAGLDNPKVKIFAHPSARRLNEREGIDLDWEKIFDFCLKKDKWLEINADPIRLDLPDILVHEAVRLGLKLTMGTDAHHKDGLDNMRYAVSVARRGWAKKSDIINTLPLNEFEKLIS